jgi:hypothetical protein
VNYLWSSSPYRFPLPVMLTKMVNLLTTHYGMHCRAIYVGWNRTYVIVLGIIYVRIATYVCVRTHVHLRTPNPILPTHPARALNVLYQN